MGEREVQYGVATPSNFSHCIVQKLAHGLCTVCEEKNITNRNSPDIMGGRSSTPVITPVTAKDAKDLFYSALSKTVTHNAAMIQK